MAAGTGMAGQVSVSELRSRGAQGRGSLRSEFGDAAYRNWLKKLTLVGLRDAEIHLAVPTRFVRDWIGSNYADRLRALWSAENPTIRGVEVIVDSTSAGDPESRPAAKETGQASQPVAANGRDRKSVV